MPTETILSICIAAAAVIISLLGFTRNKTHDTEADATERATMNANILYIRNAVDDIKLEFRAIKREVDALKTQVVRLEQSVQSAHQRLDDMKGK